MLFCLSASLLVIFLEQTSPYHTWLQHVQKRLYTEMVVTIEFVRLWHSPQTPQIACHRPFFQPFTTSNDSDNHNNARRHPVLLFECLRISQLSIPEFLCGTDCDPTLATVRTFVLSGCPSHLTEGKFQPFWMKRGELSVSDHGLLWCSGVIVLAES